jgi:hypothetical protein
MVPTRRAAHQTAAQPLLIIRFGGAASCMFVYRVKNGAALIIFARVYSPFIN